MYRFPFLSFYSLCYNKGGYYKMNRRIKKKFDKRDGCKTYLNFRLHRIMKVSEKYMTDDNCMILITDSKRMDLKHPQRIRVLTNVMPVGVGNDKPENTGDTRSMEIEFKANTTVGATYNAWLKGVQTNDTI